GLLLSNIADQVKRRGSCRGAPGTSRWSGAGVAREPPQRASSVPERLRPEMTVPPPLDVPDPRRAILSQEIHAVRLAHDPLTQSVLRRGAARGDVLRPGAPLVAGHPHPLPGLRSVIARVAEEVVLEHVGPVHPRRPAQAVENACGLPGSETPLAAGPALRSQVIHQLQQLLLQSGGLGAPLRRPGAVLVAPPRPLPRVVRSPTPPPAQSQEEERRARPSH